MAFIEAGEKKIIFPPFPASVVSKFKLKVFSPSIIDRELCFVSTCSRGDSFVVVDVQQRIIKLNNPHSKPDSPIVNDAPVPTSSTPPISRNSSSTSLRRNFGSFGSSMENLAALGEDENSSPLSPERLPVEVAEDEIFVLNASAAEVTVSFFRDDAISFLFPLDSQIMGERTLAKGQSRTFRHRHHHSYSTAASSEAASPACARICMRVRQSSYELDFCTVQCGNAYAVTDGLID